MFLEPPTHTEHSPAPGVTDSVDTIDPPGIPSDLTDLASRGRRDVGARRELADVLLMRRWSPDLVAGALGMQLDSVRALSRVRRPGTASAHVAAALVPTPRPAADATPTTDAIGTPRTLPAR